MKYVSDKEAKEAIIEFGRRVYQRGLVAGNAGNLSCRVDENTVWVTPTMQSKGYISEDMLVKLDLDGKVLSDGKYQPSSETKMHLRLYKESEKIGAVVHAHPPIATAYACCGRNVYGELLPEAAVIFGRDIPLAPYGQPGTYEIPDAVAPFAKTNSCCLLENHGALTWGATMQDAEFHMETLENYCSILMYSDRILGGYKALNDEAIKNLREFHDYVMSL